MKKQLFLTLLLCSLFSLTTMAQSQSFSFTSSGTTFTLESLTALSSGSISISPAVMPGNVTTITRNTNYTIVPNTTYTVTGAFTQLDVSQDSLTSLNVSGLTQLTRLDCDYNNLSTLDLSELTNLTVLYCNNNQLATLNLSELINLTELRCSENQFASLNLSGLTQLTELECENNQLSDLNLSELTELTRLLCSSNQFSVCALDELFLSLPTKNTEDDAEIYIANQSNIANDTLNRCKTSIAANKNWKVLNYYNDTEIVNDTFSCTETDPKSFTFITNDGNNFKLGSRTQLSHGEIIMFSALAPNETIHLEINSPINITSNTTYTVTGAFEKLDVDDNNLTSLNLSELTQLTRLDCDQNNLSTLDLSELTKLQILYCNNNQLATLNLSGLTNLTELSCSENQLTTLNLSGLTNLKELYCYENQFSVCGLDNMFTSLPTKETADHAEIYIADHENIANDTLNRCKTPIAANKNWKVLNYYNGTEIVNDTFDCPETPPTSIAHPLSENGMATEKIYGLQGEIHITPSQTGMVRMFDIMGREHLRKRLLRDQTYTFAFPTGIYIVKTQNGVTKVMVR